MADSETSSAPISIRQMVRNDAEGVLRIYADGLKTRNATFETTVPSWEAWSASKRPDCRAVAVQRKDDERESIMGFIALSPKSSRSCYRGVCEVTLYVAESARGRGVGRLLLEELIQQSEAAGIWTLEANMFPENIASIHLHEKFGFRVVGRREKIGQLDGVWRDTMMMERRSTIVGVEDSKH